MQTSIETVGLEIKTLCDSVFFSTILVSLKGLYDDEWMEGLGFYVLFNSISVISGRWAGVYD